MSRTSRAVWLRLLLGFTAVAASAAVSAQSLEEVVVSAQRRETNLQDTPLAVTAVSAERIDSLDVQDIKQLASFIPNLTVLPTFAYGNAVPKIVMRGVGAGGFPTWGIANDSAVGIYIDGMYYSRNPGSILSLAEIENVEVLRGPQGTLFGRNTTGGAISYKTFKADPREFSGYGQVEYGNLHEHNYKAGINVPLFSGWAIRLSGASLKRDGQIWRGPVNYGAVNSKVFHVAVHGNITDKLSADFTSNYTDSDTAGEAQDFVAFNIPPNGQVGRQMLALSKQLQAYGQPPIVANDPRIVMGKGKLPYYCALGDPNPFTFGDLCNDFRKFHLSVSTAKFNYDVTDHIKVSSLTGFLAGGSDALIDAITIGTWARRLGQHFRALQQEFQVNFNYEHWNAVGGLIYYREKGAEGDETWEADLRPCPNCKTTEKTQEWDQAELSRVLSGVPNHRRHEHFWQLTDSKAAFAQATYTILPKWDVTGGVRYTRDKKDGRIEYLPDPISESSYKYANVTGMKSWSATDYRVSTQYRFTDDLMLYIARSKAYKAGIMNRASVELTINSGNPLIAFTDPETVVSNEVGIRTEWFNKRLRFNATYFDMNWGNRTGTITVNDENGNPHFVAVNQADVGIKGYELEATFAITDSLILNAAKSHNKARQKDNPSFVLSGNAEDNWNAGLTYNWRVINDGTLSSTINWAHTGPVYTFDSVEGSSNGPNANNATPGYDFTSARISYTPSSGKWQLAIYSQNLLNKTIDYGRWSVGSLYGGPNTDPQQALRALPRTFGGSFRYNF